MRLALLSPFPLCLALGACGAAEDPVFAAEASAPAPNAADEGGPGAAGGEPEPELPPEREIERIAFTPPAAGRYHVWVASPANDTVVRIHAQTLEVTTIEVGDEPTVVRTRAGHDAAVVLNRGSDELSYVQLDEAGAETVDSFELPHHFNALTLHPTAPLAFCWLDLSDLHPGEDASAVQDLAVVDLEAGTVRTVAIGFRPRRLLFSTDGATLLAVTDDGLSTLNLEGEGSRRVARTVPLATDPFQQVDREVAVSPDAAYAVSHRGPDEPGVTVVDIAEGTPRRLRFRFRRER